MTQQSTGGHNPPAYDPSKFTDHDPLIGDVTVLGIDGKPSTDPTKQVDAITHTVEMPKPKTSSFAERTEIARMAQEIANAEGPISRRPVPGESRRDFHKRSQAASMAAEIRRVREREAEAKAAQKKPRWNEHLYTRALVKTRKTLRKHGYRDSDLYRFVSEKWWNRFNRMGGYKSKVEYRKVGDRSHKDEEQKLQKALDSYDVSTKVTYFD